MKKWIALLALLSAFPPLSTDMYLPALPSMARQWQQPLWIINLTLVCFFLTYSIFCLYCRLRRYLYYTLRGQ